MSEVVASPIAIPELIHKETVIDFRENHTA